jgi:phospholipase/carboxylesterase
MIGRSWFDLDVPTIQGSIARGDTDFLAQKISPALAQTTEYLLPKVESISSEYDEVILAGFSQGSFVAFDLMLSMLTNTNMAKKVTKAMLLSSTMARPKVWAEKIANLNGQKIFQSHGLQDPVLPLQGAESLKTALEASNAEYKYLGFAGGHEVPMEVLGAAGSFLQFH